MQRSRQPGGANNTPRCKSPAPVGPDVPTVAIRGLMLCLTLLLIEASKSQAERFTLANARAQDKQVKIYGVGGHRQLEAFQSGFLISDEGHILTVWSYVLDTDDVTIVLNDGRRYTAEFLGADPRLEIAVLKIDASGLPFFALADSVELAVGDRVLAFSNLYGIASGAESASLLQGYVSAIAPLTARRGAYETPYDGPVYVVDAITNNAGAAGGALTDHRGRLAGMLGKELRNARNNIWLNYAIPISELVQPVEDILAGKSRPRSQRGERRPEQFVTLDLLGIILLPNVLPKTPPYVQRIVPESAAARAGLQPDDLVVTVGNTVVQSRSQLEDELSYIDQLDPVPLTVMRDQELIPFQLTLKSTDRP